MKRTVRLIFLAAPVLAAVLATAALAQEAPQNVVTIDRLPRVLDRPGTTYVMKEDLSCDGSGLLVFADDVTVDLGGNTLTYGDGEKTNDRVITYNSLQSGNVGHHGIYAPSGPREGKDSPVPVHWNTRRKGVVIRNGTVRSGGGGVSYSDAILLTGTTGAEVKDLVIEIGAADSSAVVAGERSKIHDCKIIDTNTRVSNRHQQLAVIVLGPDSEVSNCTIDGGAQAGIKAGDGADIHHNDIRQNAAATNGYAVMGYGRKNVHVHHNRIVPVNGRGIHVSEKSVGWVVDHNYVEVRETANAEYPRGMDTHGIKLEGCRDAKVLANVVVSVSTKGGNPTALNLSVEAGSNNEVSGNVFVARKVTPKERAAAVYLVGGDGTGTRIADNVFFTNDRAFECYWTPGRNFTFTNDRFYRLGPDDPVVTFYFWNSEPATGLRFVDCTFGPGLSATGHQFPDTKENWPADAEYSVDWTMTLKVTAEGRPVAGAKVTAITTKGLAGDAKIYTTGADGTVRIETRQLTVLFHSRDRTAAVANAMPYAVRIDGGDAGSCDFELTLENASEVEADLKTKKHVVTPRQPESAPDLARLIEEAKRDAGPRQ